MSAVDLYTTYAFLKRLVTPFKQWRAYKLGIIDAQGNQLKARKELQTLAERDAFGYLDILALNLKKLLAKVPGGSTTLGSMAAAALLLKERPKIQKEDYGLIEQLPVILEECLEESRMLLFEEEGGAPTNAVGDGSAVAGLTGDPPVTNKSKYKKKNEEDTRRMLAGARMALVRRAIP